MSARLLLDQIHDELLDQIHDERSRRVVLVSHCLLNDNTRHAGGATRPGAGAEAIDELIVSGCGIHQLPCPERLAWGGVLKRHSLRLYHSRTAREVQAVLATSTPRNPGYEPAASGKSSLGRKE